MLRLVTTPDAWSPRHLHERGFTLPLTSCVGRIDEVAGIKQLLESRRLISLCGPAGCGKTRLAHQVAADLLQAGGDVWWIGLSCGADGRLVPEAVAKTLGVKAKPGQSLIDALVDTLRPSHALLVLDDCDDVVEAVARLAETLTAACPQTQLIVTGQGPLGVAGEAIWPVGPLAVPPRDAQVAPDALNEYEAVRLFVARARDNDPTFSLTDQNAALVAQICRDVDGIPLALELAAARVRVLSLGQIAERLSDRFRFLRDHNRSGATRRQTLEAAVDWSYRLLSATEQTLLRRLSVFRGGFTLESVEVVCSDLVDDCPSGGIGGDDLVDLLTRLSEKALLTVDTREAGQARYRLLETIRHYGRRKLDAAPELGEAADVRRRHIDYFTALAVTAEPHLGAADQAEWLARLDVEFDNLLAALDACPCGDRSDRRGLRLVAALWPYWRSRGFLAKGRALMSTFLAPYVSGAGADLDDDPILAHALIGAGQLAYTQGLYAEARDYLDASLTIAQGRGDTVEEAVALNKLGNIAWMCGDYGEAMEYYRRALDLRRAVGDQHGIAMSLDNLGVMTCYQGDPATARGLLEESLALRAAASNQPGMVNAFNGLGEVARSEGQAEEAARRYSQSIELARAIGDQMGLSWPLHNLGLVYLGQGQLRAAAACLAESLRLFDSLDDRVGAVTCLGGIGALAVLTGHAAPGTQLLAASEQQLEALGAFLAPTDRAIFRRNVTHARSVSDPLVFARAWAVGAAMTYSRAFAQAEAILKLPLPGGVTTAPEWQADAQARLELELNALGPVRVVHDGRELTSSDWTYTKAKELLFYLLERPTRTFRQVGLALWPDASPAQLRRNFHNTLYHLRRALGAADWIVHDHDEYAFNRALGGSPQAPAYRYDVEAFERHLDQAQHTPSRAAQIDHLEAALKLYRGDFLADVQAEWTETRRAELRQAYTSAALTLGGLWLAGGQIESAKVVYQSLLRGDPNLEQAHRGVMLCLAQRGEIEAALRQYQTLVEQLAQSLNVQPEPETVALVERLRAAQVGPGN